MRGGVSILDKYSDEIEEMMRKKSPNMPLWGGS
jgi:hypothetical protein